MAGERFGVRNSGATAVVEESEDLDVIYDRWHCGSFRKNRKKFCCWYEWRNGLYFDVKKQCTMEMVALEEDLEGTT
jgi:hypothetical protein